MLPFGVSMPNSFVFSATSHLSDGFVRLHGASNSLPDHRCDKAGPPVPFTGLWAAPLCAEGPAVNAAESSSIKILPRDIEFTLETLFRNSSAILVESWHCLWKTTAGDVGFSRS